MQPIKYSYAFHIGTFPAFTAIKLNKQNITLTKTTKKMS